MNTREVAQNYRINQWTEIIREYRSSGQTVTAWCAEHNINPKSYYYWLKRLRTAACEVLPSLGSGNNTIVPVDIPVNGHRNTSAEQGSSADIVLRYGSVILELHNNASATLIENALRALQNVR